MANRRGEESFVRIVQAGVGGFGKEWARRLASTPDVTLVGIADPSPRAREWAVGELGMSAAACVPTVSEALALGGVDGVVVTTPPPSHAEVSIAALTGGAHVLVEKPLATNLEDGRSMIEAADRAGRLLMVSQNYRFRRSVRTVQHLVAAGTIGPLQSIRITFRRDSRDLFGTDDFRLELPHPLLTDMAIHHFDLLRAVTGQEVMTAYARSWRVPDSPYRHEPAAIATFSLDDGTPVLYDGNWAPFGEETSWNGHWELLGEGGRLDWRGGSTDVPAETITLQAWGEPERVVPLEPVADPDQAGTLRAWIDAISTGVAPETDARDNIRSLAIVLGCVRSVERGELVSCIEPPLTAADERIPTDDPAMVASNRSFPSASAAV